MLGNTRFLDINQHHFKRFRIVIDFVKKNRMYIKRILKIIRRCRKGPVLVRKNFVKKKRDMKANLLTCKKKETSCR